MIDKFAVIFSFLDKCRSCNYKNNSNCLVRRINYPKGLFEINNINHCLAINELMEISSYCYNNSNYNRKNWDSDISLNCNCTLFDNEKRRCYFRNKQKWFENE